MSICYRELLEHSYAVERDGGMAQVESRFEYLSSHIFDFTTYDSSMDELFARKAVEVCAAITNRTTFDYIKTEGGHEWYLIMCNMSFFAPRIEWGTSIRGAWWCASHGHNIELRSCGLWSGNKQLTEPLIFTVDDWAKFILAVIEFAAVKGELP